MTAWFSSYEENNFGDIFYALIRLYKPKTVVELGTKAGYSAYHIAQGLKENGQGKLFCYDLWEKYPYHSVPLAVAQKNLENVSEFVQLTLRDVHGTEKLHESVDILHVDISNDGEVLEEIIPHWVDKVQKLIIIEGGSFKRDQVEWMIKFHKKPIQKWLKEFWQRFENIEYFTLEPFPSITLIRKK